VVLIIEIDFIKENNMRTIKVVVEFTMEEHIINSKKFKMLLSILKDILNSYTYRNSHNNLKNLITKVIFKQ